MDKKTDVLSELKGNEKIIEKIMRLAEKGKSPDVIADSVKLPENAVRVILQIYYTHPGIDVQGILDRL